LARRSTQAQVRRGLDEYTARVEELERLLDSDISVSASHDGDVVPPSDTSSSDPPTASKYSPHGVIQFIQSSPEEDYVSPVPDDDGLPPRISKSDSSDSSFTESLPQRQSYPQKFTQRNLSRVKYIDYLERLGEEKCSEAERLISRLLDHRTKALEVQKRLAHVEDLKTQNIELADRNRQLRSQLSEIQDRLTKFVIRHKELKAENKTRELQQLAALRREIEVRGIDFLAFVLSQLKPHIDGAYDVDEESVKRIIVRAAAKLRSASLKSSDASA
jgi:hypothetical protein